MICPARHCEHVLLSIEPLLLGPVGLLIFLIFFGELVALLLFHHLLIPEVELFVVGHLEEAPRVLLLLEDCGFPLRVSCVLTESKDLYYV